MATVDPEVEELPEEYRDRFSRVIAVCSVVTTLLAALVGYMLALSSGHSADAATSAQRYSVEAAGETARAQQEAQTDFEAFVLAEEHRTRSSTALQRQIFEADLPSDRQLEVREDAWSRLADKLEKTTPLATESEFGPDTDPLFPTRFFTSANENAYRLGALQDAAQVVSDEWGQQASGYTAVLTIFAVALYLFGLSLTLGRESRRLFSLVASALVAVGFGWALLVYFSPPEAIPDQAADAYAAGEIARLTAASQADYAAAAEHYREAIAHRPDFALAHARLASAAYGAGTPQRSGFVTITTREALDESVKELERARELGLETVEVVGSLGADYFQQAILHDDPQLFDKSVEATAEALAMDPERGVLKMNLGLATFAAGDADAGRKLIREAAQTEDSYLHIGAMGDLDLLQNQGPPDVADAAPAMKEYLAGVSAQIGEDAPTPEDIELRDLEITAFPSQMLLEFKVDGQFDPNQEVLNVFWYHQDEQGLAWSPVPELSGFTYAAEDPEIEGGYYLQPQFLTMTSPRRCLAAGPYRVEVFAGDELVGTAETETAFGQMEASAFADLNAAICRPADWERATEETLAAPGLVRGYRSSDDTAGVFIFRMQAASGALADLPPDERARQLRKIVLRSWDFGLGSRPRFNSDESSYFMGHDGGVRSYYDYDGGQMLVGAGVDDDGAVVLGVSYGPIGFLDEDGWWMLGSAVPFNDLAL